MIPYVMTIAVLADLWAALAHLRQRVSFMRKKDREETTMSEYVLEVRDITKRFPGVWQTTAST